MMRCPYCVSEIADEALACPRCAHDLYLFKPLLEKIEGLEKKVKEQSRALAAGSAERIAALEQELAAMKAAQADLVPVEVEIQAPRAAAKDSSSDYYLSLLKVLFPALVLLLLAQGLLLFKYDVNPLYLRVATILIPVPFGFLLAMHHPGRLGTSAAAGFATAFLAVFGMLAITATVDKVPLLPHEAREWRETLEYVLSIGLAFTTGFMAGEFLPARRQQQEKPPNRVVLMISRAMVRDEDGKLGIVKAYQRVDKLVKTAAPAITGAASFYAGIKSFLGALG
jgi:hypothetical protein